MIRPMTNKEIVVGLRRSAVVCIERNTAIWYEIDVTRADAVFEAAYDMQWGRDGTAEIPEHAATFLLFVAEALETA